MKRVKGFTLIELLVVIAIIAILAAILFPVLVKAKEAGRRTTCVHNMKQIAVALNMYADSYNGIVPTFANNTAAYSGNNWAWYIWAGLLDRYIPGPKVQGLDKAWSPLWLCPSDPYVNKKSIWWGGISYGITACLYTSPGYPAHRGGNPSMGVGIDRLRKPSKTIYCAEHGKKPPWTGVYQNQIYPVCGPWEITYEPTFGSLAWYHDGAVNVLFADGHVGVMQVKGIVGDRRFDHNNTYWNVDDWVAVMK